MLHTNFVLHKKQFKLKLDIFIYLKIWISSGSGVIFIATFPLSQLYTVLILQIVSNMQQLPMKFLVAWLIS